MNISSPLYRSTRAHDSHGELDFLAAATTGLARDGGLYLPTRWPQFSTATLRSWRDKPYSYIAEQVLGALVGNAMPATIFRDCIQNGLSHFTDPAITPLRQIDDRTHILELFHGPTFAFKDVALQFLGQVFGHALGQRNRRATIVGATSGDTGSAAIAGCAGIANLDVFILYPQQGPSEIQRRQMTTVAARNVHVLAIDGSFDDCQAIVKSLFNNAALREQLNLTAVNSINWARIAAQIVYYFVAAVRVGAPDIAPSFVVPTGNFGNIFAGFAALQMGLPIAKLAAATNTNNAVHRFFTTGSIAPSPMQTTLSPSMDIQVPSNLERLLFTLAEQNGAAVHAMMAAGHIEISPVALGNARQYFTSASIDDTTTLSTIRRVQQESGVVLDPHTAVGVAAARQLVRELPDPIICLGCAHPAKFPETMARALEHEIPLPPAIAALLTFPERVTNLPADLATITKFLHTHQTASG